MSDVLIVCAAPAHGGEDFYRRLISAYPGTIVAADGGAALCRAAGRVPDVVVGDLDSITSDVLRAIESDGVPVRTAPADKDVTDLDIALDVSSEMAPRQVTVTAAWSARLDHTLAAIGSVFAHARCPVDVRDPGLAGWMLDAEMRCSATIAGPGATFSLFSLDPATHVSCTGARYPLDRASLAPFSSRGLSNVIVEPTATITIHRGRVLVLSHATGGVPEARSVPSPRE